MTTKLAVVIVLVIVALLSVAGCTTSTNQSSTNPSAQPSNVPETNITTSLSKLNPLLVALEPKLKTEYAANNVTTSWDYAAPDLKYTALEAFVSLPGGQNVTARFNNYDSVANATAWKSYAENRTDIIPDPSNATHFAQDAVQAVLGHTPTVVNDTSWQVGGVPHTNYEVIQYDTFVVTINRTWGS
jgi:hypothetical protein